MLQGCYDITSAPALCDTVAGAFGLILIVLGVVALGGILLLITAGRQVRNIDIPPDADFFETLRLVPITIPLALDMLDFAFDIFAAPVAWIILELMGLKSLQFITVMEALIPGTQILPTMTIGWVIARSSKNEQRITEAEIRLRERQARSGEGRPFRSETMNRRMLAQEEAREDFYEEEEEFPD